MRAWSTSKLEDMTPPEAWEKARAVREQARANRVYRSEAGGRPSKRDRRLMDAFENQGSSREEESEN